MKMKYLSVVCALALSLQALAEEPKLKDEDIRIEENPELVFENFSLQTMKDKEQQGATVTPMEKATLASWFKDKDVVQEGTAKAEPQQAVEAKKKELAAQTPAETVKAPLEDVAPLANNSVQNILEEGKVLVLDSKTKYLVPTLLRQKTAAWKSGDMLKVEDSKRANWVKITNLISNETILAKIDSDEVKK